MIIFRLYRITSFTIKVDLKNLLYIMLLAAIIYLFKNDFVSIHHGNIVFISSPSSVMTRFPRRLLFLNEISHKVRQCLYLRRALQNSLPVWKLEFVLRTKYEYSAKRDKNFNRIRNFGIDCTDIITWKQRVTPDIMKKDPN